MELRIFTRRRTPSIVGPCFFSLPFNVLSFEKGSSFTDKIQQDAAAVQTEHICLDRRRRVKLARSMHFISFPAASKLVGAASNPTGYPPDP